MVQPDAEGTVLRDAVDAGEEFLRDDGAVVGFAGFEAVVTGAAVVSREFLAEVGEELGAAAAGALGVMHDLAQLGAGDGLLVLVGDLGEEVGLLGDVAGAEEQEAVPGQAVAPGAAGFLVVALDVFRQVVMNDPADVGLVDAHAEGDGRADDAGLVPEEKILVAGPLGGIEAGVVGPRTEAAAGERLGDALGGGAAGAVDDAALGLTGADEIDDLFCGLILGDDAVGEIGAVEAGDEGGGIAQAEVLDDVGADAAGRGGGEGHHGQTGQQVAEPGDLPVFGTEIVAPLGDAMRLVDGQGGDVPRLQVLLPVVEHQALGGDVEQSKLAAVQAAQSGARLVGIEGGIQVGGGDPGGLELVHLILHQRDEGRDHDGETRPQQGGELETERLAPTGGQQGEDIAAGEGGLDDLALQRVEAAVAEGGLESKEKVVHKNVQSA